MNISSMSSAVASITGPSGLSSQGAAPVAQDDADPGRPHRAHGGGHMHQAVMQALQSLGLSPASTSDPTSSASSATGDATSSSSSSASSVGQDMRQFMHSLFEAVRSESSASTSASPSATGDGQSGFASGLSALISQVSSGNAPADLQGAFSTLASDLQGTATTSASGTDSTTSGTQTAQASLQSFLTRLQQNLGYGSSSSAALGNLVTTQV